MRFKFWFDFEWMFSSFLKKISFKKAIKLVDNPKYVVVEFVNHKRSNSNHFPNAIQINILQYEDVLKLIKPNQIVLINNKEFSVRQYYRFLKIHNYKVYMIKQ